MTTMIEKVARALAAKHYADRFSKAANDEHVNMNVDGNWPIFTDDAKVAIQAMREPSEKVLDAGLMVFCELDGVCSSEFVLNEVHKAMIDAALKETNP